MHGNRVVKIDGADAFLQWLAKKRMRQWVKKMKCNEVETQQCLSQHGTGWLISPWLAFATNRAKFAKMKSETATPTATAKFLLTRALQLDILRLSAQLDLTMPRTHQPILEPPDIIIHSLTATSTARQESIECFPHGRY
jgi:hypothetical protein